MEAVAASFSDDPSRRRRVDLALCYRLVAHYGLTDQIYTHISARVPGTEDRFLLNRLGPGFDEMTASDLVEVGLEAPPEEALHEAAPGDIKAGRVNRAGHTIHSAVYMARPEVGCALHLHSRAGMAVAALEEGLLPLNQISMQFYDRIAYHDYEGIALDLDERVRLAKSLGPHKAMILKNHGLMAVGQSIAEAFAVIYQLEKSCQTQLAMNATTANSNIYEFPPPEVCEHAAQQAERGGRDQGASHWPALVRLMEKEDPSFRE